MSTERPWSDECPCGRVHGERRSSRMKPACETCEHIHTSADAVAVGRFRPEGPLGYRAATAGTPLRAARAEAEADECAYRTTPHEATS